MIGLDFAKIHLNDSQYRILILLTIINKNLLIFYLKNIINVVELTNIKLNKLVK
jgi:hypothetical protein